MNNTKTRTAAPSDCPPRWTRSDSLDLGPYPGAVPSARLHARALMGEWRLDAAHVDAAESVVAELVANAVEAHQREHLDEPVRLTVLANLTDVMIVVRDASDHPPLLATPDLDEETGRGLLIVEALSRWDWKQLPGGGKVIRSLIEGDPCA